MVAVVSQYGFHARIYKTGFDVSMNTTLINARLTLAPDLIGLRDVGLIELNAQPYDLHLLRRTQRSQRPKTKSLAVRYVLGEPSQNVSTHS